MSNYQLPYWRCQECKQLREREAVVRILGVWVCNKCYPKGHKWAELKLEPISKRQYHQISTLKTQDKPLREYCKNCKDYR